MVKDIRTDTGEMLLLHNWDIKAVGRAWPVDKCGMKKNEVVLQPRLFTTEEIILYRYLFLNNQSILPLSKSASQLWLQ